MQCSLLPDVGESHEENHHEYEHLTETEERHLTRRAHVVDEGEVAGELLVVDPLRDHEDSFDVEDNEQNGDEVELDGESLAGVAENRNS